MEIQFSKIILGTVQLGMPYGRGRWADEVMPEKEAFKILDIAFERGITTLDTSPDYGLAEERIARYLMTNPNKHFHIITKVKKLEFDAYPFDGGFEQWLDNCPFLNLDNCSSISVLLHREKAIRNRHVRDVLSDAVDSGRVRQWGVSVYGLEAALVANTIDACKVIQLPFGPLNQSFARSGLIAQLADRGKIVIARSVFAQGRLIELMKENSEDHRAGEDMIVDLRHVLINNGISITNFALSLALSEKGVAYVVIGADSPDHIDSWSDQVAFDQLNLLPLPLLEKLREYDGDLGKPQLWQ